MWRKRSYAFFGVCSFGCTHFFIFGGIFLDNTALMIVLGCIAGGLIGIAINLRRK